MPERKLTTLFPSLLEYRIRQLVPAVILTSPLIWDQKEHFTGEGSKAVLLIAVLFTILFMSFITESIGEVMEKGIWHCCKHMERFKGKHIVYEWYQYLLRDNNTSLIADKYLAVIVERMKLRCSAAPAITLASICFSIQEKDSAYLWWILVAILIIWVSIYDIIELINLRKSIVNSENRPSQKSKYF